jgi:hypothetical protein
MEVPILHSGYCLKIVYIQKEKVKLKVHLITGHKDPEGE